MRIQPKTKTPKVPTSASLHHAVRAEVERAAKRFGVSKSWVVTCALAEQFGIDVIYYYETKRKKRA